MRRLDRAGVVDVVTSHYAEGRECQQHSATACSCVHVEEPYTIRCFSGDGFASTEWTNASMWRPFHSSGLEIGTSIEASPVRGGTDRRRWRGSVATLVRDATKAMKRGDSSTVKRLRRLRDDAPAELRPRKLVRMVSRTGFNSCGTCPPIIGSPRATSRSTSRRSCGNYGAKNARLDISVRV